MKLKLSRVSDWMTSRDKKQNPIRIEWSNHSWIAWVWNYYIIHWLEAAISAISINQVLGRWHIIMLYVCAQLNHERCSTAWTAKKKKTSAECVQSSTYAHRRYNKVSTRTKQWFPHSSYAIIQHSAVLTPHTTHKHTRNKSAKGEEEQTQCRPFVEQSYVLQ